MNPYEELAELAESALPLAAAGRLDDVAAALAGCEDLATVLPPRPPPAARPALERALAAQAQLRAALGDSLATVRTELDRADRGRRAARTYAVAAPSLLDGRA